MHIFLVRIEGCGFDSAHSVHFGRYTGRQLQRRPRNVYLLSKAVTTYQIALAVHYMY